MNTLLQNTYFRRECLRQSWTPFNASIHNKTWYFMWNHLNDYTSALKNRKKFKNYKNVYALQYNAMHGNLDVLRYLIEKQGVNINTSYSIALRYSAENGHLPVVQYLVEHGANIHAKGDKALLMSFIHGHYDITWYLLDKGADILAGHNMILLKGAERGLIQFVYYAAKKGAWVHENKNYALRKSARNGHLQIVQFLIQCGANIHAKEEYALRKSVQYGHLPVVQYLIEQGANIYADKVLLSSVIHGHIDVLRFLLEKGGYRFINDTKTCAEIASLYGHLHILQYLMENFRDETKSIINKLLLTTIMASVCTPQHLSIIQYLIQEGADLHGSKEHSNIALCAYYGHLELLKYMISLYEERHVPVPITRILHSSCGSSQKHIDIIAYFLYEYGIDVHYENDYILRKCIEVGNLPMTKYIIEQGADVHKIDKEMLIYTPFPVFTYVIEHGIDIHEDHEYFLRTCAGEDRYNLYNKVVYLVERGADIHACNDEALRNAREYNPHIYQYLTNYLANQE